MGSCTDSGKDWLNKHDHSFCCSSEEAAKRAVSFKGYADPSYISKQAFEYGVKAGISGIVSDDEYVKQLMHVYTEQYTNGFLYGLGHKSLT